MSDVKMEAKGINGQTELSQSMLRIKRGGLRALLTQGLKGDKEILISKISSVQFKKASLFTNGYIQFAFIGGQEAKGGILQAANDENSVLFSAGQEASFEAIRIKVQEIISAPPQGTVSAALSPIDELEKLALLRDKGIVSHAEFEQAKKRLLGL